jgi:hypothetical protein
VVEDAGKLALTEHGEAGRLRGRDRNLQAHERMLEDIETADFVTTINVLRRIVANLGGNSDLP